MSSVRCMWSPTFEKRQKYRVCADHTEFARISRIRRIRDPEVSWFNLVVAGGNTDSERQGDLTCSLLPWLAPRRLDSNDGDGF